MPLRKEGKKPKPVTINCTVGDAGFGDCLAYLVVVDHILKEIPWVKPLIWVPDYLKDFAKHVLPQNANINNFTAAKAGKYNDKILGVSTRLAGQHTPMRIHPIDYAAHMLLDGDLPIKKKNYLRFNPEGIDLSKFNLPEKYVVVSVGATTKTKELPLETMKQIVDYVIEKGYTPVFLGKKYSDGGGKTGAVKANLADIDYTKGLDLTDKTNIMEACAIIAKSKAYVGMEGGLCHLAGFTDVPIISGYSFVDPDKMLPIRNSKQGYNCYPVIPEESLECRYCQTRTPLLYEANYFHCWYGPDDYTCLKQLTFSKWKMQIDKVL